VTEHTTLSDDPSHDRFVEYYAKESVQPAAYQRFAGIRDAILRAYMPTHPDAGSLSVADIACNAGTQSIMWAKDGHSVHGLDINEQLLAIAGQRARDQGVEIDFRAGSATDLPWEDESMDICIVPELLEHVVEWEKCLDEFCRILKPGGMLFLSTTNRLCPVQQEFDLPIYSWYPGFLKRYYERVSVTTRPELVNYAEYPAVNWFTYYSLRDELRTRGLVSQGRFDVMDTTGKPKWLVATMATIRKNAVLHWLAQAATPYTVVFATKPA